MTTRRVLLVYAVLGVALWPIPLFNILHVEAAAVVAFVAFFVAGWGALDAFTRQHPRAIRHVLLMQEGALLVPLGLLTLSLLWTPNCDYARGLLFYGLFPGVTVVFAVAVAYALSGTGWRYPKAVLTCIGVGVALLGPLYDLGLHPQFYTYNHVFGGVLGPIYDEELAVRSGLFTFRGLTLLWALLFFFLGRWLHLRRSTGKRPEGGRVGHRRPRRSYGVTRGARSSFHSLSSIFFRAGAHGYAVGMLITLAFIAACYAFAAPLGFNTPAGYLQAQLGGHLRTEHFDLYYDPASLADHELAALAEDHEYRYAWLEEQLSMDGPERVASYLYPDAATKARLTGARATSVVPVWLPRPQSHVLLDRYEASFGHELVHVFSRRFGLPIVNASWAVGLVEGVAVALAPPDGRPTPHEQVSAALLSDRAEAGAVMAGQVAARLQPYGFWTERGAVSYTTMGSFVQFLIDRYGAERFRAVYARANFEAVYGRSLDALTREWVEDVRTAPALVARDAEALVSRRFARPSLFERRCPHHVPRYRRAYRAGRAALAASDTVQAETLLADALREQPNFTAAHRVLARLRLAKGEAEPVIQQLGTHVRDGYAPALDVLLADAYVLQGRSGAARAQYEAAFRRLPRYAHAERALVTLRTAVAGQPGVVRILVSADSAHVQAERLEARSELSPAVRAWAALRHMEAGQYDRAAAVWAALPDTLAPDLPPSRRRLLRRQLLMWRARCALRRGTYAGAQDDARSAAEAFRAVGAFNLAVAAEDLARKAHWAMR